MRQAEQWRPECPAAPGEQLDRRRAGAVFDGCRRRLGAARQAPAPRLPATAWITAFGTAALIPVSLAWEGTLRLDLPWTAWGSIAALGLGCSATSTALWNWGLRHMPAGRAGLFPNIEPLTGAILGITVLAEPLNANIAIGGAALIIGSAAAATRRHSPS